MKDIFQCAYILFYFKKKDLWSESIKVIPKKKKKDLSFKMS